jgi:hypothetical protein
MSCINSDQGKLGQIQARETVWVLKLHLEPRKERKEKPELSWVLKADA